MQTPRHSVPASPSFGLSMSLLLALALPLLAVCGSGPAGDVDGDECALDTDNCDVNAACTNTDGSFACAGDLLARRRAVGTE